MTEAESKARAAAAAAAAAGEGRGEPTPRAASPRSSRRRGAPRARCARRSRCTSRRWCSTRATDIKRLSEEEARRAEDAEALASRAARRRRRRRRRRSRSRRFADELGASETARRDAEAKTVGLQKQNALLLGQLEDAQKAADGVADEDGENAGRRKLHEVVTFLRNEKEAALGQVEVLSLEVSRWKRSAETSKAESAQSARRAKELEKRVGKTESEGESKIEALKAKIEHLNVVSESNAALRAELDASQESRRRGKEKGESRVGGGGARAQSRGGGEG